MSTAVETNQELTTHINDVGNAEQKQMENVTNYIPVGVYCWILRISKIDLIEQYMSCKARIMVMWPGTKDDYIAFKQAGSKTYKPKFDAFNILILKNCITHSVEFEECDVFQSDDILFDGVRVSSTRTKYVILSRYVIEGDFIERFALKNYPLDCQDLEITFLSSVNIQKTNEKNYILVPPLWKVVSCSHSGMELSGHNIPEYDIVDYIPEYLIFDDGVKRGAETRKVGMANFRVKISRRWSIYFWKIGIFSFVSSFASMVIFTMENTHDIVGDKYGILLTLLLTSVAFEFVISSLIPDLPYNTYLDWYVIGAFIFIFMVLLIVSFTELTVNAYDMDMNQIDLINSYIGHGVFALFLVIQIGFMITGCVKRRCEIQKLKMDTVDLHNFGYESTSGRKAAIVKKPQDFRIQRKIAEFINIEEMFDDVPSSNIKEYNAVQ